MADGIVFKYDNIEKIVLFDEACGAIFYDMDLGF